MKQDLIDEIQYRLSYNEKTGKVIWVNPPNNHAGLKGKEAGTLEVHGKNAGRVAIIISKNRLRRHQIAWIIKKGYKPKMIDHIDGNPGNDAWENLRETDYSKNNWNISTVGRKKKSNWPVGVRPLPSGRFQVRVDKYKKRYFFGPFNTLEQAIDEHKKAKQQLHGEYARGNHGSK